jgi:hypothetical protein
MNSLQAFGLPSARCSSPSLIRQRIPQTGLRFPVEVLRRCAEGWRSCFGLISVVMSVRSIDPSDAASDAETSSTRIGA